MAEKNTANIGFLLNEFSHYLHKELILIQLQAAFLLFPSNHFAEQHRHNRYCSSPSQSEISHSTALQPGSYS